MPRISWSIVASGLGAAGRGTGAGACAETEDVSAKRTQRTVHRSFLLSIDQPQFPSEHLPRERERRDRERGSAEHERDHDDVPRRPVVVQPGKIHRMKSMIQPPIE